MPNEDSADHEFVFLALHRTPPPTAPTSTTSSSSSSSSSKGLPKFPHLRPIPIHLESSSCEAIDFKGNDPNWSPPRSPPPVGTCSSRMSPLPMELIELLPPRLRLQGYTSPGVFPGSSGSKDNHVPPTRPPPPTNYQAPSDYCYLDGNTPPSGNISGADSSQCEHNYDYLRELVVSDAVAVLASNSSPVTSLARSAVKSRPLSPSPQPPAQVSHNQFHQQQLYRHLSPPPTQHQPIQKTPKFTKPDFSSSISYSSSCNNQMPSPKFSRLSAEKEYFHPQSLFVSTTSVPYQTQGSYNKLNQNIPFYTPKQPLITTTAVLETANYSVHHTACDNSFRPKTITASSNNDPNNAGYSAVLTHDGNSNPVLKKLQQQTTTTPFLASFRSASNSPNRVISNTASNRTIENTASNSTNKIYRSCSNVTTTPTQRTPATLTTTPFNTFTSFSEGGSYKAETATGYHQMPGRGLLSVDQSNYVVPRSYINTKSNNYGLQNLTDNNTPISRLSSEVSSLGSSENYTHQLPHRLEEASLSDGCAPRVPPRKYNDTYSDSQTSSGRRYPCNSTSSPLAARYGISKLSYPLSDKYTNVLNANVSSIKVDRCNASKSSTAHNLMPELTPAEASAVPPPMEKLRLGELTGRSYSVNNDNYEQSYVGFNHPGSASSQNRTLTGSDTYEPSVRGSYHPHVTVNRFASVPNYPQAGCAPLPTDESSKSYKHSGILSASGNPWPSKQGYFNCVDGSTNEMTEKVNSNDKSSDALSGSPILSRVSYRGQHRFIQPLPAPPPLIRWSPSQDNDPDSIYDNLVLKTSGAGGAPKFSDSLISGNNRRSTSPSAPVWAPQKEAEHVPVYNMYPNNFQSSVHETFRQNEQQSCPTCLQQQNGPYRSSSCERLHQQRPSPSTSPQLIRRGGSASPSLRHSPSPDPGGGGWGKPPRPRRQQYRRMAYVTPQQHLPSPQPQQLQQQPLICSDPNCSLPHIHQPTVPSPGNVSVAGFGCHQLSTVHQCTTTAHLLTTSHLHHHPPPTVTSSDMISADQLDVGDLKLKGPTHRSLYRCVRSLLMPNQ